MRRYLSADGDVTVDGDDATVDDDDATVDYGDVTVDYQTCKVLQGNSECRILLNAEYF